MSDPSFWAACKRPSVSQAVQTATQRPQHPVYPESINLPFNRRALPPDFVLHPTPQHPPATASGPWVLLQGGNVLLQEQGDVLSLPEDDLLAPFAQTLNPLCFASLAERPVRAATIAPDTPLPDGLVAEPFNAFRERIPIDIMSMAGLGKQVLHWQQMSRFCSRCNALLEQLPDSWGKSCTACTTEHFPHIHPCAIVLIRRDDQLLLIRKPEWPMGRYSLVAGFLDMGESMEECAMREAMEETGVTIKNVRYITSQAWPFPAQMMVGFVADYASGDIKVDGKEIEDARWFTIGSLPSLPASRSIARYLIDTFGNPA